MKIKVVVKPDECIEINGPFDTTYGHKASGISLLPQKWCPNFFIISHQLYSDYKDNGSVTLEKWENTLLEVLKETIGITSCEVIVRSSADLEDIENRGQYYSKVGNSTKLSEVLRSCINKISKDRSIKGHKVSFIVQRHISAEKKGHLSNERRCYKDPRDWLYEVESADPMYREVSSINLRPWRQKLTSESSQNQKVSCLSYGGLKQALKVFASWGWKAHRDFRLHFEWVWDGETVWLVQADKENKSKGTDPRKIYETYEKPNKTNELAILREIDLSKQYEYQKVQNVCKYTLLGFKIPPLFILDDQEILIKLQKGKIDSKLKADLTKLVKHPLIIRMDIAQGSQEDRQMLPRTNEIKDIRVACDWLLIKAKEKGEEFFKQMKPCLIFHNFIPALASAFSFAKPKHTVVQIEALWGLPEGLYYNSHDKFRVDTLEPQVSNINERIRSKIKIIKDICYKPYFVAPKADGTWSRLKIKRPCDWLPSISEDSWIKEIAVGTRKIAELDEDEVSVMWFIDVCDDRIGSTPIPWHHESFDVLKLKETTILDRKKTNLDRAFKIETKQDIERLNEIINQNGHKNIKRITINPREDELLREKDLLAKVGELSKKIGSTIVLQGAMLSHAYYQLNATGAIVEVTQPFFEPKEKQEFNKLVRDNIPQQIENHGEKVDILSLSEKAHNYALLDKLIEEAYEAHDAIDRSSLIEEIADINEIIDALLDSLDVSKKELKEIQKAKKDTKGGFKKGLLLKKTALSSPTENIQLEDELPFLKGKGQEYRKINESDYIELAEHKKIVNDHRKLDDEQVLKLTLEIPVVNQNASAKTKKLTLENEKQEIEGEIHFSRNKSKVTISVDIKITGKYSDYLF